MDKKSDFNIPIGVGLAFFVLMFCLFFASLFESHAGEIANATGAIMGGALGALGAAGAVYLTLRGQRDEERARITDALLREIIEFSRFAINHLDGCVGIANGKYRVPISALPTMMEMPEPIIYRATADRLGLTNSPQAIVSFYTGMNGINTVLAVTASNPNLPPFASSSTIEPIAGIWIEVLKLATTIIENADSNAIRDDNDSKSIITDIKKSLADGRSVFPEKMD